MAEEEELKKLSRVPENKRCANCDVEGKFGHSNICTPFKIFVCSNCKSALQAFSFRVKSISMSTFTREEVEGLRGRNGGGNDAARRTWMALLPHDSREKPREGDPLDKYKAFVQRVYIDKAFYSRDATVSRPPPTAAAVEASPTPVAAAAVRPLADIKGRWGPPPAAAPAAPAPIAAPPAPAPPEPEADLLGLTPTPTAPAPVAVAAPRPTPPAAVAAAPVEVDLLGFGSPPTSAPSAFPFLSNAMSPTAAPAGMQPFRPAPMPTASVAPTSVLMQSRLAAAAPAPAPPPTNGSGLEGMLAGLGIGVDGPQPPAFSLGIAPTASMMSPSRPAATVGGASLTSSPIRTVSVSSASSAGGGVARLDDSLSGLLPFDPILPTTSGAAATPSAPPAPIGRGVSASSGLGMGSSFSPASPMAAPQPMSSAAAISTAFGGPARPMYPAPGAGHMVGMPMQAGGMHMHAMGGGMMMQAGGGGMSMMPAMAGGMPMAGGGMPMMHGGGMPPMAGGMPMMMMGGGMPAPRPAGPAVGGGMPDPFFGV